jgi:CheY-like chemotaxis protein
MRMRVLVAGRNAKALATAASAFADDLTIATATTRADCLALLERTEFDLIVACETLGDGSGLEVLSHAAVNTPDTLRIFAARSSTLEVLKGELGLFGLFRTLSYPINFRKLWAALDLARSCRASEQEPEQEQEPVVLQVRGPSADVRAPRPAHAATVARTGAAANDRTATSGVGTVANGRTAASGVGAAASRGAAVNSGASAHTDNPSKRVQARLAAMASAGAAAQLAPNATVRTVHTTAAAGSDKGARPAAAAAARTGAAVNGGRPAHAATPSRQTQPRQGVQARATPTATQRSATTALATAGTTAAASSGTGARGASAASARTGAIVNNGRAAQAASPSREVSPRQDVQARATPATQRSVRVPVASPSQQVQPRQNVQARATPATQRSVRVPVASPSQQVQPRQVAASHTTRAQRRATAVALRNARIPETEAFKRALAKRNAAKLESNADMSAVEVLGAAPQSHETAERGERRREPRMSNDSLAQLARLTITRRPTHDWRGTPRGKKRAAFFVGSGVFAAATAAVLTFFMMNENNSMGHSRLPLVASIEHPVSQKVFPWQPAPQQPTGTLALRTEATASAAADMEVQAEAASDASAVEPGHPGPPPPNPPPPPAEPPSADSPGWVDE